MPLKTVLGAGLFSAVAQNKSIHVSSLWWFWAAVTFPLTGIALVLWGIFCWRQELRLRVEGIIAKRRLDKSDDIEKKG